jgi:signal-transduction protein with cAMP-binding, CBS, and nucleotidyltransferase domain
MLVRDAMTPAIVSVGAMHTIREAARRMAERKVGAAIVIDPQAPGPGIITERDVLEAIGAGADPDMERVSAHLTRDVVYASPTWSLEEAAASMVRGSFRHLVVLGDSEIVGVISVRDIIRAWVGEGASCGVAAGASNLSATA